MFEYHYKVWWNGSWIVSTVIADSVTEALEILNEKYPERSVQILHIFTVNK